MAHNLLQGKRGIITGALNENSIAWKVAQKVHEEGGKFVLSNAPITERLGNLQQLADITGSHIVMADATSVDDITNLFEKTQDLLGGKVDFILHAIAMSSNIRRKTSYSSLNYDAYQKAVDVSALSLHKILSVARKLDAINEWGSVVALSYGGAQRTYPFYTDMADIKAMLESVARGFGYNYGRFKKVRVNTVSQSPTDTKAGASIGGFDHFFDYVNDMSPLGNASAEDCANFCVALFSDFTRMITMQNIFHDGGFSSTGISYPILKKFGMLE
jgi:enoyl-[acyl-carrier protein] reductase I